MSEAGEGFKERATRELARVAAVFAAGEAEIADTYFNWDQRDTEKEVLWLTKQAGREIESTFTGLKEIVEKVGGDLTASDQYWVDKWGGDVDRNWLEENLWRTKQELNHGNLCVDIVEWLTGEPVDIKEVVRRYNRWTPDPSLPDMNEWVRLAEVFKEQEARQESWARLINSQGLLEGGSCGLFYAASQLSGSELNDRLAKAFTVVLDDERGHGPANIYQIADAFTADEAVNGARELMVERGIQRLRMRNEQFSFPIDEARIQDIAAGNIGLDVTKAIWGETLAKFID